MTYTTLSFHKNGYRIFLTLLLTCLLAFGSYSAQAALKLEWAKRAGGAGFDVGNQIAVDSSGNAYVAGIVTDPATFGLGESSETTLTSNFLGAFVAKYSASGDLIWVKPSGSPRGLAVDNSGSVYVMGNFTNTVTFGSGESSETTLTSDGGNDIFLAKYTADGDLVWAKRAGGISFDVGSSLAVDGSGNAYLTGFFSSGIATFGSGEANEVTLTGNDFSDGNLFVAKYTASGNLVWAKRAEVTDGSSPIIAVDGSGNAYIVGSFGFVSIATRISDTVIFGPGEANEITLTLGGVSDLFVAKYTTDGDLVSAKRIAETGGMSSLGGLVIDDSGNTYVTGVFENSAIFGLGQVNEITLTGEASFDIFVAKYTISGDLVWAKRAVGRERDFSSGLAVDSSGNAYISGSFSNAVTFGLGEANETTLTTEGVDEEFDFSSFSDIFVAKYTSNGDLVSAKRAGGMSGDRNTDLAIDSSGNAYVTGSFSEKAVFGPGEAGGITLTSDGGSDVFVAKYSDNPVLPPVIVESRVTASSDDAEETFASGRVNRGSRNLKLVNRGRRNKVVGLRFNDLAIPQGATITNASIQFQADKRNSGITTLLIEGEATDHALTFTRAKANISSRGRTNAAVDWEPAPWTKVGEAGPDQQTPNIASVIQEIVDRPRWFSGNSLAIIISGTGRRTAESFNGNSAAAPVLHVEYAVGTGINQPPTADAGPDQTIVLPNIINLDGTVNDDGLPNSSLATTWSKTSGPGTARFGDFTAEDTTVRFDLPGIYVLRLTVDDEGGLNDFDELTVTVNSPKTFIQGLNLIWAKDAEGNTGLDQGSSIAVDSSGNTYVAGSFSGIVTFGLGEASETTLTSDGANNFVAKYTVDGNLVWAKRAGSRFGEISSLTIDSLGNAYVTGYFTSTATFGAGEVGETMLTSDGDRDIFVAKYSANGELIWAKRAGGGIRDHRNNLARDQGRGIAVDSSGNAYVIGTFESIATFGSGEAGEITLTTNIGSSDIFIAKYTTRGNLIWAKRAGGNVRTEQGSSLAVDSSGNAYVTGFFSSTATFGPGEAGEITLTGIGLSDNIFVAKYTANGDLIWAKRAGGGSNKGNSIAVDSSGNTYVTGNFRESATFGPGEAGETTLTSDSLLDIFVAKYTASGDLIWAKRAGGSSNDQGNGIAVDSTGNAYVTGFFRDTATFGPGEAGEITLTGIGFSDDIFVAKYTTNGDLVSVKRGGGEGFFDRGIGVAVDSSGNTYVTGSVGVKNATFGLGEAGETTLTNFGFFVAKFSSTSSVTPPVIVESRVTARSDDAEEKIFSGRVNRGSRNLKLVDKGRRNTVVGLRFNDLAIPQGVTITNASIQFQADKRNSGKTTLWIEGESTDNALTFTRAKANISSRDRTISVIEWEPVPWKQVGEAGPDQQTPDMASVIQEIVNRPGWSSGNSLAIIISGTGRRTAESFNGNPAAAPLLHIEYTTGNGANPPQTEDILLD